MGDAISQDLLEEIKGLLKKLSSFCETEPLRIVLCGAVKAGKSSLINNILSAFKGKVIQIANVSIMDKHATGKYIEYRMKLPDMSGQNDKTYFVVCDTRGIQKSSPKEQEEAMKAALEGKYLPNQNMDETSTGSSMQGQERRRGRAVYLIIVIDATELPRKNQADDAHKKEQPNETNASHTLIETIQTFANREAIPLAIFLTKCDKLDGDIDKDLTKLEKSEKIKSAINFVNQVTGIPESRIFPIVNYNDQKEVTPPMRLQILNAFKHIITDVESSMSLVVRDSQ